MNCEGIEYDCEGIEYGIDYVIVVGIVMDHEDNVMVEVGSSEPVEMCYCCHLNALAGQQT